MKCISIVAMFVLGSNASVAFAGNEWCEGKLSGVYVTNDGDVVINGAWRGQWTRICNVRNDDVVDTVTCSLWSSLAATAVKESLDVLLMYSLPDGTTCSNIPSYAGAPRPYYVMLKPR